MYHIYIYNIILLSDILGRQNRSIYGYTQISIASFVKMYAEGNTIVYWIILVVVSEANQTLDVQSSSDKQIVYSYIHICSIYTHCGCVFLFLDEGNSCVVRTFTWHH